MFDLSVSGYLQCVDSDTSALVQMYNLQIQTLSYSQTIHPVVGGDNTIPQGCAVAIASDKCTVHLMLKVKMLFHDENVFSLALTPEGNLF